MPDAFVAIDLDNVLGGRGPKEYGCLGKGREATLAELALALEVILRRLNWTIGGGRATMNRATQDWIDPGVIDLLRDHKIPIGVNGGDARDVVLCLPTDYLCVSSCGTFDNMKITGNLTITYEKAATKGEGLAVGVFHH